MPCDYGGNALVHRGAPSNSVVVSAGASTADVPETPHRYPKSEEPMGPARAIGRAAGLLKIGRHIQRN